MPDGNDGGDVAGGLAAGARPGAGIDSEMSTYRAQAEADMLAAAQIRAKAKAEADALAVGWAELEAVKRCEKEAQDTRDIELLERDETLRQQREALEARERLFEEMKESTRHTTSFKAVKESTQHTVRRTSAPAAYGVTESFVLCENLNDAQCSEEVPEDSGYDEIWDMDWSSLAKPRSDDSASTAPSSIAEAAPQLKMPAHEPYHTLQATPQSTSWCSPTPKPFTTTLASATFRQSQTDSRGSPPHLESASAPKQVTPEQAQELKTKLHEKRQLAELHNGEDHTIRPPREFEKGSMPGVNTEIARKLEERRLKLEGSGRSIG